LCNAHQFEPGVFAQTLTNLIMNSLKHGFEEAPAGGINIALNRTGQNIAFIYGDTGKGIPGEHLKKYSNHFLPSKEVKAAVG
jgi:two-component system NtrC family sensor kinase